MIAFSEVFDCIGVDEADLFLHQQLEGCLQQVGLVVQRSKELSVHCLGFVEDFLEQVPKAHLFETVSVLLAALPKNGEESFEATHIIIEGIAGYLNQLWKVFVRDIVNENLASLSQRLYYRRGETERGGWEGLQNLLLILLEGLEETQDSLLIHPLESNEGIFWELLERYYIAIGET